MMRGFLYSDREDQRERGFNDFLQTLSDEGKAYVNGSVSFRPESLDETHAYAHYT